MARDRAFRPRTASILALALLAAGALHAAERFEGHIVDMLGGGRRNTARFTLQVDQFTTDEEVAPLVQVLASGGQEALVEALTRLPERGWLRIGDNLGYTVQVIRSFQADGGRVVRVLTDRPIQMFELRNSTRSADYPVGIVELRLDAEGKGEGTLIVAASARFDEHGKLEIESYRAEPLRILSVRTRKPKD